MKIKPPIIQLALDYADTAEAIAMAKIGVEAGFDWLEAGTPLIVSRGLAAIGELVRAFPKYPVLADYKTMDSGGKNVEPITGGIWRLEQWHDAFEKMHSGAIAKAVLKP